jgi:hypothetical protein
MSTFVERVFVCGAIAGTTAALATALIGRRETGSYAAPLNATSHILWGDEAALEDDVSSRYTGTGAALHYGASWFWAVLHEALPGPAAFRAPLTALTAYVVDYHLVPRRLTPGFELRISPRGLAGVYAALAAGLWAGSSLCTEPRRLRRSRNASHRRYER